MNKQRRNELNPEIIDDYSGRYIEQLAEEVRVARVREFARGCGECVGCMLFCVMCVALAWVGFAL